MMNAIHIFIIGPVVTRPGFGHYRLLLLQFGSSQFGSLALGFLQFEQAAEFLPPAVQRQIALAL